MRLPRALVPVDISGSIAVGVELQVERLQRVCGRRKSFAQRRVLITALFSAIYDRPSPLVCIERVRQGSRRG